MGKLRWIILQNEEAAQIEADHRGVDYQGLYVHDRGQTAWEG